MHDFSMVLVLFLVPKPTCCMLNLLLEPNPTHVYSEVNPVVVNEVYSKVSVDRPAAIIS